MHGANLNSPNIPSFQHSILLQIRSIIEVLETALTYPPTASLLPKYALLQVLQKCTLDHIGGIGEDR